MRRKVVCTWGGNDEGAAVHNNNASLFMTPHSLSTSHGSSCSISAYRYGWAAQLYNVQIVPKITWSTVLNAYLAANGMWLGIVPHPKSEPRPIVSLSLLGTMQLSIGTLANNQLLCNKDSKLRLNATLSQCTLASKWPLHYTLHWMDHGNDTSHWLVQRQWSQDQHIAVSFTKSPSLTLNSIKRPPLYKDHIPRPRDTVHCPM